MIVAQVNLAGYVAVLRRFPGAAGTTMDRFLDEQARLLVSSSGKVPGMVQVTPPHSAGVRGSDAKKQGERAVTRDIAKVYASPAKVYAALKALGLHRPAAAYWAHLRKGDVDRANRIASSAPGLAAHLRQPIREWDDGAEHQRRRGHDGRVKGDVPSMVIRSTAMLWRGRNPGTYTKRKLSNVGLLASSLPHAVGGRFGPLSGVPGFVKRHSGAWGICRTRRTRNGRVVTLGISKGAHGEMQRRFNYVLQYRMNALQRQLPYLIRKLDERLRNELQRA